MVIEKGEKVHIITRRLFEGDIRRHFVGEVLDSEGSVARVEGYAFVYDSVKNDFVRKPGKRVRIFDLAQTGYIVCVLPDQAILQDLHYKLTDHKNMICTDGKSFQLDISEFGAKR
jgi:hypothetical protein